MNIGLPDPDPSSGLRPPGPDPGHCNKLQNISLTKQKLTDDNKNENLASTEPTSVLYRQQK